MSYLRVETIFYVYGLYRAGSKMPFYIGKGCYGRINRHESHARNYPGCKHHVCRIIRKVWREGKEIIKTKLAENLSEQDAYDLERLTIEQGKTNGWPLVNLSSGGLGCIGYQYTPEQLEKKIQRCKEMLQNPDILRKISEAQRLRWTSEKREETGIWSKQMWSDPAFREKQMRFLDSPEFQEARLKGAKKTKNAKSYSGFVSPSGIVYKDVHNLKAFCREHHLSPAKMCLVNNGKRYSHQGWTRYKP